MKMCLYSQTLELDLGQTRGVMENHPWEIFWPKGVGELISWSFRPLKCHLGLGLNEKCNAMFSFKSKSFVHSYEVSSCFTVPKAGLN